MDSAISSAPKIERGLTTGQVAAAMGCHAETVRRLIKSGKITAIRWGNRYRIPESEFERIQREGTVQQAGEVQP